MREQSTACILQLDRVDVEIEGHAILHGITLAICPGEHWGLVGANGSGKSTLLALISGKRWPAPGRGRRCYDFGQGPEYDAVTARTQVALLGHELQDLYAARGWNFTVLDVVLSGLTRTDIPQRQRSTAQLDEAAALLQRLRLDHLARRRLLDLSRGEQRRVLIARALAFRPALLLLDEPASGLDADSRQKLEATLDDAAALTQLVIAAHGVDELPAIVNRRARIVDGRLHMLPASPVAAVGRNAAAESGKPVAVTTVAVTDGDKALPAAAPGAASSPPAALIELTAASAFLDGRQVLCALDWQLLPGEHWLVTGPNGAGKSSFLRLLHGELRPARGGSIRWPGLGNPRSVWTLRERIALVSAELQARYRYPTSVFDAIGSGFTASIGRVRRLTAAQTATVESLLAEFELDKLADRALSALSYGQRHRTLIARTLATEPRVLLLDEPWEGLDTGNREIVTRALRQRMDGGSQVICVSHVGAGGLPLNRRLRLEAGRIVRAGDNGARGEN